MEIDADIEEIVLYQVAQKVLENLPEDKMRKILETSLAKSLQEILSPWDVQKIHKKLSNLNIDNLLEKQIIYKINIGDRIWNY